MTETPVAIVICFVGIFLLIAAHTLYNAYRKGIRDVPGPWFAKFSIAYRLSMVINGKAPEEYGKLHEHYVNVVRVGPNQISINDPSAIPQIYGVSSRFGKVNHLNPEELSLS